MTQRIALVTGASSGIGRVTARALVEAGFVTVITGRRQGELEAAAAEMADAGEALPVVADVGSEQSVANLFNVISERYGRLDLLFNNAGINAPENAIDAISLADWQSVVDTNLTGVFLCTRAAFAMMKAQDPRGGRIVNNGSISAYMPRPGSAAYTATKHGVLGLTRQTALDGRPYDIACGQIDIGNAATEMTMKMTAGVTQADGSTAVEPRIDARHVADAVVYMANLPLGANVLTMNVMATKMPFVGRG